ncbi:hypothetical protein C8Q75DRAFT_46082 [Abortiporus biennis]|nr:hypothetical protein C8Q75DRAFT_46082 [Abortiporus biennis]
MSPVPQGSTESPASSSIRDPVPEVPKSSPMNVHSSGGSHSDDLGSVNTGKLEQKNTRTTTPEGRSSFEESSESSVEDIHDPGSGSIETPPSSRQSEGPKPLFVPRKDSSAGGGSPTEPPQANVHPGSAASSSSAHRTAPLALPKSPVPPGQIGTNPAPSRKPSLPYESVGKDIAPSEVVKKGDTRTTETQRTSTETSPSVENIHDHDPSSSSPKTPPHGSSSRQDCKSPSIPIKRPDTEDDSPPELPDVSPVCPAGPTSPDARLVPPKSPNEPLTSPGNNPATTSDEPSVKPIVTIGDKSKMPSGSSGEHIRITRETTISLKIRSLWDSKSQKLKTETLVHDFNTGSWETLQNYEVHSEQPPYIGTEGVTEDGQGSKLLRHIEEAYEISNEAMGRIMMCSKNLEEYSECDVHSESIEHIAGPQVNENQVYYNERIFRGYPHQIRFTLLTTQRAKSQQLVRTSFTNLVSLLWARQIMVILPKERNRLQHWVDSHKSSFILRATGKGLHLHW